MKRDKEIQAKNANIMIKFLLNGFPNGAQILSATWPSGTAR